MKSAVFAALVDDIRKHGQLVPIVIRGDEVIDGRKRLAACQELGIEPRVVNLATDEDAEARAISLNLLRTHYSVSQRAMLAAKRVNATPADGASIRYGLPRNNCYGVVTARQAGAEAGVDPLTVKRAKRIRRKAAPEVVQAVEAGKLTLHAAEMLTQLPREEQGHAVAQVVADAKGKKNMNAASVVGKAVKHVMRSSPKRPTADQIESALDSLEFNANHIASSAVGVSDVRDWPKRLRAVRLILTRTIGQMEGD